MIKKALYTYKFLRICKNEATVKFLHHHPVFNGCSSSAAANTSLMTLKISGSSAINNGDIGYRIGVFGSNITGSLTECSSVGNVDSNFSIATPVTRTFNITGNVTLSTEL